MPRRAEQVSTGTARSLPVIVHEAPRPGPTVIVTANLHGDEATGLAATHALDALLPVALTRGTVVLYPSLNPGGLRAGRRWFEDGDDDLNRLFPGRRRGTRAERHARAIWDDLLTRGADLLVDLHADSAHSVPYALADRVVTDEGKATGLTRQLGELVEATGLTALHEYADELYVQFRLDRSLSGAMVNRVGVPALTVESGGRGAILPRGVDASVGAVRNLLHRCGMVGEGAGPHATRCPGGPFRRGAMPRPARAGVLVPIVAPGAAFGAGDLLGTVRAPEGAVLHEVRAPGAGVVVSWADAAWIEPQGVPGTIGLVDPSLAEEAG